MNKLNLHEVAQIIGTPCSYPHQLLGVSVDSRLHRPENLFFALPGDKTDGHSYLQDVAQKGAAGAVVRKGYKGPDYGLNLLFVEDPLEALQTLAKTILQKSHSRIVAITGSLGKTSTKDFLTTILKEKFHVASSPGNSNSKIGLPLAVLNHTNGNEDIVVLEMGMTHSGQIRKLIELAPPECAIITSVALVHACNFESLEEIAFAKAEILEHNLTKIGIINHDIPQFDEIVKKGCPNKISFSYSNSLANYYVHADETQHLRIQTLENIVNLGEFPFPGKHHKANFLAAAACAHYFGMSWEEITLGIKKLLLPELRGRAIEKNGILFINDSYNAAELSVKAALENLPNPQPGGRKIAVLADMLELGKFSEKSHREVGNYSLNYVDQMFCYGDECRHIKECWQKANRSVQWFSHRSDLLQVLRQHLKEGDVVLIKGSRGTQISKLLEEWEKGE